MIKNIPENVRRTFNFEIIQMYRNIHSSHKTELFCALQVNMNLPALSSSESASTAVCKYKTKVRVL